MDKLRFALLGCGRISRKHYEALAASNQVELVSVCDINVERAKDLGEKLGVSYYSDYNEMLSKEKIDVVNILTPSGMHAEHTVDIATKYKKHIVCEKPMALTLRDADMMIEVCNSNNVKLFVVKQNRYNLPVLKLREAVEQQRFGKPVMGTVRVRWMRDQKYYDQDDWRGTWAMDGGVFANQASHHIDLLLWVMGTPVEVSAKTATQLVDIEVEDTGIAIVRFESGALGVIEATTATRPKDLEGSISIMGEKGTVEIGGFALNEMRVWQFADEKDNELEMISKYKENPPNVYGFGHVHYMEHVIDCIMNGKKAFVDGVEGRKSIQFITALYESTEIDGKIKIDDMSGECKWGAQYV